MNTSKQIHESGSESSNAMTGIRRDFNLFDVVVDLVVVGINTEMADYDNRHGEIYGFAAHVRACNEYGDTRTLYVATARIESEARVEAGRVAAALNVRINAFGRLPIGFYAWSIGRPVYGSQAYLDYGRFDDIEFESLED